jgi:hypothetical protein
MPVGINPLSYPAGTEGSGSSDGFCFFILLMNTEMKEEEKTSLPDIRIYQKARFK